MVIWFDMDGTFVDLYGVENWLEMLVAHNEKPYEIAKPLFRMNTFARELNKLKKMGYEIGVISWLAKNSNNEYDNRVKTAKENAEINNISDKCEFIVGDLADKITGKYKVICANIVADVIIKLFDNVEQFLEADGVFITSVIIDIRKDDVLNKANKQGFEIVEECYKDNWCAFVFKKI